MVCRLRISPVVRWVTVAVVASTHGYVTDVLDRCERWVAQRPEIELLSVRRRVLDDDDLD